MPFCCPVVVWIPFYIFKSDHRVRVFFQVLSITLNQAYVANGLYFSSIQRLKRNCICSSRPNHAAGFPRLISESSQPSCSAITKWYLIRNMCKTNLVEETSHTKVSNHQRVSSNPVPNSGWNQDRSNCALTWPALAE